MGSDCISSWSLLIFVRLRILNGRTFGDSLGFYACFHDNGGVISVDYILVPDHLFDKIRFFLMFNLQMSFPTTVQYGWA